MALTDTAIRNAKPGAKPARLFDERGLYLEVTPAGGKWWRFRYRFGGKSKLLSMGTYPDTALAKARERRDEARKLLADGIDPSQHRKATKAAGTECAANSFEVVAREWYGKMSPTWNVAHGERIIRRLERDIFPWIGARPVAEATAPELLGVLRRIEARGPIETAHRALQNCGQVFLYAIADGRTEHDASGGLRGALAPVKGTHCAAAVTDPAKGGGGRAAGGKGRVCRGSHASRRGTAPQRRAPSTRQGPNSATRSGRPRPIAAGEVATRPPSWSIMPCDGSSEQSAP